MTECYRSSKGDACIICDGKFPFPTEDCMGIYLDRKSYPHKFICWECVHWVSKRFQAHINGNSYNFLFMETEKK